MPDMKETREAMKSAMKRLPTQLTLDHVSPATILLEKRRQMLEVQQALDAQKEEYSRKEDAFRRREESLRKKDLELQESLVQFNKFLKDKYDKRSKYDRMAQEERKQRLIKEKEIQSRLEGLKQLREKCSTLQKQVRQFEKYHAYLSRVQEENNSDWPEIDSVLSRYQALELAHNDLNVRQIETIKLNESLRNEFSQYIKDQATNSLNLNNLIAQLQNELERSTTAASAKESEADERMLSHALKSRQLSEIIMSLQNLYLRCKHRSGILNHSESLRQPAGNARGRGEGVISENVTAPKSNAAQNVEASVNQNASVNALKAKVDVTCRRLDVIGNYIIDYMSIVDLVQAEVASKKKSGVDVHIAMADTPQIN